jgi:hypothetical protein
MRNGRSVLKVAYREGGARVVQYIMAEGLTGSWVEVEYPETHVTYVFARADVPESRIDDFFLDSDSAWLRALTEHPRTAEGHLAFGPVFVPSCFGIHDEAGRFRSFGEARSLVRELGVGGGYLFLSEVGLETTEGRTCEVRPIPSQRNGVKSADPAQSMLANRFGGRNVPTRSTRVSFVPSEVVSYRCVTSARAFHGFIWSDILGYHWNLEFSAPTEPEVEDLLRPNLA